MTAPGRPQDKSPAAPFDRLMERQAAAAVAISGAETSSWTGVWREASNNRGNVLATATWDGAIEYADVVLEPLRHMCENAGRQQTPEILRAYLAALRVMLHENGHLLNQAGRSHSMAREAFQHPSNSAYEEGVTDVWTVENLPAYIAELGLEEIAPGISAVGTDRLYSQYVGATKVLTDQLGEYTDLGGPEVRRRLVGLDAETRWPATAELVFTTSGLADMIPPDRHAWAKDTLQFTMRPYFARLYSLTGSTEQMHVASIAAGHQAAASVRRQVEALRQMFDQPSPQNAFQNLLSRQATAALAISGADHSSWNGRIEQAADGSPSTAGWDGTLSHDVTTGRALWELSHNAGRPQDPATLTRYKQAVQTMLRQNAFLLAGPGRHHAMATPWYQDATTVALDKGVTHAWAAAHTNDYIDALGLEGVAPGIRDIELPLSQTPRGAAALALATDLGEGTGLGRDEVLNRLNNVDAADKWSTAAELVLNVADEPVPPERYAEARDAAVQSIRTHFEGLLRAAEAPEKPPAAARAHSTAQPLEARQGQPALTAGHSPTPAGRAVTPDLEHAMAAAYAGTGTLSEVQPPGTADPAGDRIRPGAGSLSRPQPTPGRG